MRWRELTDGEWAELSPGLGDALRRAGVVPCIRPREHLFARLAGLWFGRAPIMALGRTIWWLGAAADFAGSAAMAVLQHELQHLLDYAEGRLSALGYVLNARDWRYGYVLAPGLTWDDLGAEQRASVAEDLWRCEASGETARAAALRALIPWAR